MQVIQKFLPEDHPNRPKRTNNPIAVIVHYTGNSNPTATALANINYAGRKYIRKNGKTYEANGTTPFVYGAGHVYIDKNEAYQIVPYNEYVAGAGDARLPKDNGYNGQTKIAHEIFNHRQNYMSIQYEICNNDNWDKACDNAIEIIAKDMIDYNIPMERVYRHHDLSGKICPAPFVNNPQAWEQFKTKLQNKIIELRDNDMFKDIKGHYAEKQIEAVAKAGIMVGDGKGNFNPNENLTRGQLAIVLCKIFNLEGKEKE